MVQYHVADFPTRFPGLAKLIARRQRAVMPEDSGGEPCALCGRRVELTAHHLIPRKLHRRTRFKRTYSREELHKTVMLCRPCHRGLHVLFDEMTLGKSLNTLEALKAEPSIRRHYLWVKKQR